MRRASVLRCAAVTAAGLAAGLSLVLPAQAAATPKWSVSDVISSAKASNWLYGIVATSKSDAWSAGVSDSVSKQTVLVMHYNGHTWRQVPVPAALSTVPAGAQVLVGASSADNAWVFELKPGHKQRILRWDGRHWQLMTAPAGTDRSADAAVAVFGRSSAWVFSLYTAPGKPTQAVRYESGRWKTVTLPGIPQTVDAVSQDDIWAYGYSSSDSTESLIMHWNGSAWTTHPAAVNAQAFAASSWNDAWLLDGSSLLHWNGASWTTTALPADLGVYRMATDGHGGVWMWGPHEYGALITTPNVFLHYSDGVFSQQNAPAPHGDPVEVAAMAPVPGTTDVWAAGWVGITSSGESGAIMGYGG